jgi:hypothetical protein
MTNGQETQHWRDTAERLFRHTGFTIAWVAFLVVFLKFVSWPIRNIFLVCWVYGSQAYFHEGIRVLKGKPIRFSNGELAPTFPDLVTGFGAFFITVIGLTILLIFLVRFYERHFRKIGGHDA